MCALIFAWETRVTDLTSLCGIHTYLEFLPEKKAYAIVFNFSLYFRQNSIVCLKNISGKHRRLSFLFYILSQSKRLSLQTILHLMKKKKKSLNVPARECVKHVTIYMTQRIYGQDTVTSRSLWLKEINIYDSKI